MMHELGASDLHLSSGSQPIIRLHGDLQRIKYKVLEHEELKKMLYEITPGAKGQDLRGEVGTWTFPMKFPLWHDTASISFLQRRGCAAVFREIPQKILSIDDLKLPPLFKNLAMLPKGSGPDHRTHGQRKIHDPGGHC
jgi:twitching motility protein PilT